LKTHQITVEAQQWADHQPKSAWEQMVVHNSTKGFIVVRVPHREIWLWDGEEQQPHQGQLVVSDPDLSKN
jgi:hypothetical protein